MRDRGNVTLDTDEIITEDYDINDEVDELHLHPEDRDLTPGHHKWPKVIGIIQICSGFLTSILAVIEVIYLPLIKELEDTSPIHLGKDNCYGAGLLGGFFMILLGSSAVRASISRRASSIRRFFGLTIFTLILYTVLCSIMIVGYTLHWTVKDKYKADTYLYEMHIFVTISMVVGLVFALTAFIQYYELVFFGQYQLCRHWLLCCFPCIISRMAHKAMASNDSLASNPI